MCEREVERERAQTVEGTEKSKINTRERSLVRVVCLLH